MFPRRCPGKVETSAGARVKDAVFSRRTGGSEEGGGHLPKEGGFDERPEGRVEGARDDRPRLFQLPGRLEAEADDGDPGGGQFFQGIFALFDRLRERQRKVAPFPEGIGQGGVPEDDRRMDPDRVGAEGDHLVDGLRETVPGCPRAGRP